MLYLNGPYVLHNNMTLSKNPGAWSKHYGMLFLDQPIGVGFSVTGKEPIPDNELLLASHLYTALQGFYRAHRHYQRRPLYVTGESYAGKYVPSLTHYILQAKLMNENRTGELHKTRKVPADVEAPEFLLGGMAIGNGFTGECHSRAIRGRGRDRLLHSKGRRPQRLLIACSGGEGWM